MTELELITLWVVILTAGLRALFWVLFFVLLRTGCVEVTGSVRPGSRWKNGAPNGNGKAAPKASAPEADGAVPGA